MNKNLQSDPITGWPARLYTRLMAILGVRSVYLHAVSLLHTKPHDRVLDVGCGTGTFLKLLEEHAGMSLSLVGVDASEDMLREARARVPVQSTITFADAANLPFPDRSFDHAVSILSFHHMPAGIKIRAIQELARVVKKGGEVLIVDMARPVSFWGNLVSFYLNFHSHTRGNWQFVRLELPRWGFTALREETKRGVVGFLTVRLA